MKIKIIITLLTWAISTHAQSVYFSQDLTWKQVQEKAKVEQKSIFVDVYATWCGPCKFTADSIFTKLEVAAYMNKNFICYQVQIDQTRKDGPLIKSKYAEATALVQKYQVKGLPTMLFLSPNGELLDQQVGSLPDAAAFIEKALKSTDTREQYYKLLEKYYGGEKDKSFLTKLLTLAETTGDQKTAAEIKQKLLQE